MKNKINYFKCIAILLVIALFFGMFSLENELSHKAVTMESKAIQEIIPESALPALEDLEQDEEGESPEETPPEDETEPQEEIEPPKELPPEELPPEEQPPEEETLDEILSEETETKSEEIVSGNQTVPGDEAGGNGPAGDVGEGEGIPDEGPEDDSELKIVTDLHNGEITYAELKNDVLNFYAYLVNGNGMTLKIKVRNSLTSQNGDYLTGDGKNYQTTLARNETTFFTLYVKDGNTTIQEVTYTIRYVAQKADENNPTVGANPPTIITNLENVDKLSNRNFTFHVEAIAYTGDSLYSSNIEVRLDGQRITNPTGGPRYEYELYFKDPEVGDVVHHTVTVRAWDNEGNSSFVSYSFDYHFVDTGGEIGTAYIVIDATTVGLGKIGTYTYTVKQNVPASYAVMEALTANGFEYSHAGSPDVGFYLQRIRRGGLMDWATIPENLWNKILQDELTLTSPSPSDSLGEFDYTQGSGWMYSVGGETYEGKGLSNYFLNDGETLYLRFTLAYGKDISGYSSVGGSYGKISTYCGKWINGSYLDQHNWGAETIIQEATCTEAGISSIVCSVCGDKKNSVEIPALGHSFEETIVKEATCTEAGEKNSECTICGEKIEAEAIPALGHNFIETSRTEPADGNPGVIVSKCNNCEEEKREEIPWIEETPPTGGEEVVPPDEEENPLEPDPPTQEPPVGEEGQPPTQDPPANEEEQPPSQEPPTGPDVPADGGETSQEPDVQAEEG